ncbi:hypothetical protein [Bradyrhizobium sp. I71]|uniref:hypothetical protein n=1 Tax=Bradyrhizobium sp. I71 TaxID=2590772 RepID=UPI001EF794E8|nr:hypothetical protein [Bradyrhizobium sp. I71]ULK98867.1 hypothetical protein FJV43_03735 [Bradyrhizobium sp. I71]
MRPDNSLLAFSLLACTALLVVWLGLLGPTNATTWKDWQPLLAAIIALGGATVVYKSAMAKVNLDRAIHEHASRRRIRGLLLRVSFALHVIGHDTRAFADALRDSVELDVDPKDVRIREVQAMDEAWSNLDEFPRQVALTLGRLKVEIFNFEHWRSTLGSSSFVTSKPLPPNVIQLRDACERASVICDKLRDDLEDLIDAAGSSAHHSSLGR